MEKLIEWIIEMLSKDGINSKALVKAELESMTIDDWSTLRDECNEKIVDLRSKGYKPEADPNILMLKSYQADVYQCAILQREIDVLSNFVRSPIYTGMPLAPSVSSNPVEQQHIRLIEAKRSLEHLLTSRALKMNRCLEIINLVSDSRGRYILTALYLEGKTLYRTLDEAPFDASYRQMIRIKQRALDEIRHLSKK